MQNNFFQQMTISIAQNKKAVDLSKSDPVALLKFMPQIHLSAKSYEKISKQSIKLGYTKEFIAAIADPKERHRTLFNLFLDNEERLLNIYEPEELIDFFNQKNVLDETTLHSIISVAEKKFSSKILNKLVPYKNKLVFTSPSNCANLLHSCFFKGIEEIEQYFDVIDKSLFTVEYKNNLPIYYNRELSDNFFDRLCAFYKDNKLSLHVLPTKKSGRSLLKSLIYSKSLSKVKILYKHFPDYCYNNNCRSYSNDFQVSFNEGTLDISKYILEQSNYLAHPLNTQQVDILWLACRYYETHKEIFEEIMKVNFDVPQKNLKSTTIDTAPQLDSSNIFSAFELSLDSPEVDIKRNYTTLLAQYGDINSLEALREKGLLDTTEPEAVYEAAFRDKKNKLLKIDYFSKIIPITHANSEELFKKSQLSHLNIWLKKPFILNIIENSRKNECVANINSLEKRYSIIFNDMDYALAMLHSIKTSNIDLFAYCKEHISLEKMTTLFEDLYENKGNSIHRPHNSHLLTSIYNIGSNFIAKYQSDMLALLQHMLEKFYITTQLQNNLLNKTDIIEKLYKKEKTKNLVTNFFNHTTDIQKKIKAIEKLSPDLQKKIISESSSMQLLRGNIDSIIHLFDLEKQKSLSSILYYYHKVEVQEQFNINRNIEYLIDKKYKHFKLEVITYKNIDLEIVEKIINLYIEQNGGLNNNNQLSSYLMSYYNQRKYLPVIFDKLKGLDLTNYINKYIEYIEGNKCSQNTNKNIIKSIISNAKNLPPDTVAALYNTSLSSFLFIDKDLFNIDNNLKEQYIGFNTINQKLLQKGPDFIVKTLKNFNEEFSTEQINDFIVNSLSECTKKEPNIYHNTIKPFLAHEDMFIKIANNDSIAQSYLKFIGHKELKEAAIFQSGNKLLLAILDRVSSSATTLEKIKQELNAEKVAYLDKYMLDKILYAKEDKKKFKI